MSKRNLMSAKQNLLMRAYRESPEVVREILETAHKETMYSRDRVKDYIMNETEVNMERGVIKLVSLTMPFIFIGAIEVICSRNFAEGLTGLGLMGFGLYNIYKKGAEEREITKEYQQLKENADRNLGYKRTRGSNQLEFLFE